MTVFAGASLTDALQEMAAAYEQQSDDRIVFNLAFAITIGSRETRQDKFAQAPARGLEARQKLAEAEGAACPRVSQAAQAYAELNQVRPPPKKSLANSCHPRSYYRPS